MPLAGPGQKGPFVYNASLTMSFGNRTLTLTGIARYGIESRMGLNPPLSDRANAVASKPYVMGEGAYATIVVKVTALSVAGLIKAGVEAQRRYLTNLLSLLNEPPRMTTPGFRSIEDAVPTFEANRLTSF